MHRHLFQVHHNAVECFMEHKIYSHHHSVQKQKQVLVDFIQQLLIYQHIHNLDHLHRILLCILLLEKLHIHNQEHLHRMLQCILLLENLYQESLLRVNTMQYRAHWMQQRGHRQGLLLHNTLHIAFRLG